MAPADLLHRLKNYYYGMEDQDLPVIWPRSAALLSVLVTLIYVVPFYISSTTRPSPSLNRDAPSVIRGRIQVVTWACIVASLASLYLLTVPAKLSPLETIHLLGWWRPGLIEIARSMALTLLLYIGPLFEKIFVEKDLQDFRRGRQLVESLSSWMGYRNYVAGPVTEEVIFRSVIIPLHLVAKMPPSQIVFITPLYFGIAHIHHFYEFTLTHPHTPLLPALLRSLFQFTYTTIFGWFAAFIYLRTGSVYACIIIHSFCNWVGLPRFWGRVKRPEYYAITPIALRGKDDSEAAKAGAQGQGLPLAWTITYYVLLFIGAYGFYLAFWPLTESNQALAVFKVTRKT